MGSGLETTVKLFYQGYLPSYIHTSGSSFFFQSVFYMNKRLTDRRVLHMSEGIKVNINSELSVS